LLFILRVDGTAVGGGISRLLWVKGIDRDLFLGRVFFGHLLDFVFVRFWFIQ